MLEITVTDPYTEDEWPTTAKNRVTTYQLNIRTNLPTYPVKAFVARQRFDTFAVAYAELTELGRPAGAHLPAVHLKTGFFVGAPPPPRPPRDAPARTRAHGSPPLTTVTASASARLLASQTPSRPRSWSAAAPRSRQSCRRRRPTTCYAARTCSAASSPTKWRANRTPTLASPPTRTRRGTSPARSPSPSKRLRGGGGKRCLCRRQWCRVFGLVWARPTPKLYKAAAPPRGHGQLSRPIWSDTVRRRPTEAACSSQSDRRFQEPEQATRKRTGSPGPRPPINSRASLWGAALCSHRPPVNARRSQRHGTGARPIF